MYTKYDSIICDFQPNINQVFHKQNSRNRGHDSSLGSVPSIHSACTLTDFSISWLCCCSGK